MTQNSSYTNLTLSSKWDELLQEAHRKKVLEYMPLIVVLFVLVVVGLIGNILTILFYGFKIKKTPTFVLILLLAIVDLIVCCLAFTTIADLCVNIMFTSEILCKCMYFLDHWLMLSSVLILWIISIHRYRRICKPLGRQLDERSAKIVVVMTTTLSMVYCIHVFIIYKPVKLNISTSDDSVPIVVGHYCTNTDDPDIRDVLITFHIIDIVSILFCFATFVFTYGNIWRTVRRHTRTATTLKQAVPSSSTVKRTIPIQNNLEQTSTVSSKDNISTETTTTQMQMSNITTLGVSLRQGNDLGQSVGDSENESTTSVPKDNQNKFKSQNAQKDLSSSKASEDQKVHAASKSSTTLTRERNITLMMFAVTVGLVVCFTPYFIGTVGTRALSSTNESELNIGNELALRFPFFNSIINPIIFCVFNPQYRRYVLGKLAACLLRRK
ncbi:D(2) dopamine receptor-like [Ruditapes philippinarum]|uniref:D(2) dopamine receptor-like n=1 Tax=Ruditapes philippinarum TaxID=129788 RepID=UPI00295AE9F2|nr:D(2) dopamine receptor-like [Ruditapes philippinarum]